MPTHTRETAVATLVVESYAEAVKIASWNVNSIRAREDLVLDWMRRHQPDVVCFQETKIIDDDFPSEGFLRLGYSLVIAGQKSYNGVAIAALRPMKDVCIGLIGDGAAAEKRFIAATVDGIRVCSAYVPNGKSIDSPSFKDKLSWLGRLKATLAPWVDSPLALCGDFNVALEERDVWNPDLMRGQLHFHPDEHAAMQSLLDLGLVDAFRIHHTAGGEYSWFDYRGSGFRRNEGLRIDYVFLSPPLAGRCLTSSLHLDERRKEKPSDHLPVVVELQ